MDTIKEAKIHLRENFNKGTSCPCCGQFVKLYKRRLYSSQAAALIHVWKKFGQEWFHKNNISEKKILIMISGGDFAKLRYWGLVVEQENIETEKRASGIWRVTEFGENFALNKFKVKSHILLYNQKFIGFDGEDIDIYESLGNKFNYQELMQTT